MYPIGRLIFTATLCFCFGSSAFAQYKVNSGGGATSPFTADANFSGGSAASTTATIDMSGVTSPAPQAVYQTERYGNTTYTFGSLTANTAYTVRLHFAETWHNGPGSRKFDVSINGTQVLNDYDVFAAAGAKNKAVITQHTSNANASGQIVIQFTNVVDNAKISGIEIIGGSTSNPGPTVSITSPGNGATYNAPASIAINASASDSNGSVSSVQFFAGSTSLGTDTTNPYSVTWNSVAAGSYSLTARATDNGGAATTSSGINVTVKTTATSSSGGTCGNGTGPTDNPVYTKYGSGSYPWTANIKWSCVYNINNYSGATMAARFNAARDAAAANSGGVVYFPTGTYNFTENIFLKSGVVIRGETPSVSDAKQSTYNPGADLVFPKYTASVSGSGTPNSTAFKYISTTSTNTDSNIGIVNVDINRGAIKIVAGDPSAQNNQNILVFGVRNNNVAEPDAGIPTSWQNAWQRWSYRFACNVKVMGKANILVANNRVNDAITDSFDQPNYLVKNGTSVVTLTAGSQARFEYGNHYGIDINRAKSTPYSVSGTPTTEPSLFRTGIVIRDNYVYHTMRIAITASGDGLLIRDNIVRDKSGKVAFVDPTGRTLVGNSATLENRAIDWAGYNITVSGNDFQVNRHLLKTGPYYSVDGEGILLQACCGGSLANGATISNNNGNAYIGLWKTRDINNVLINANTVNNGTGEDLGIYVDANVVAKTQINKLTSVRVTGNTTYNGISMWGDTAGGTGNVVQNNTNPSANSAIHHSCNAAVSISGNTGFTVNACRAQ